MPPCSERQAARSLTAEGCVHDITFCANSRMFINICENKILLFVILNL